MKFQPQATPHRPSARDVSWVMGRVLLALIPAIGCHIWLFGWGLLIQLTLALTFALGLEAVALRLRGQPVGLFLRDHSAAVTAVLFALCMPPLAPWPVAFIGMVFAIVVAKHFYGGLGSNLFNPAMVGFAAVIIAFPEAMTQWITPRSLTGSVPDLATTLSAIFFQTLPADVTWDVISEATPLDRARSGLLEAKTLTEIQQHPSFGALGASGWSWLALAYLLGGLYLLRQKVITWPVPATILLTTVLLTLPGWLIDPDVYRSPVQHLVAGSLMMCAFFIATDPVSGSSTPRGKLVFCFGVVAITLSIRAWGGFPDGVAFAILLMNMFVPLIDKLTPPRAFGETKRNHQA